MTETSDNSPGAALPERFTRLLDAQTCAPEHVATINAEAERGLWALADLYVPTDVREAAQRWHLDHSLPEIWRQAFIQGWRASQRAEAEARRGLP